MSNHNLDIHNLLSNPSLPVRPRFFDVPESLGPSIVLPFQQAVHDWKGDHKLIDIDLAAWEPLSKLTAPYRFARLTSFEVVFLPRQHCHKYPGTAEVRFLPSDVKPEAQGMLNHPGAISVSLGGPFGFISNSAVPCPLNRFSAVIKSPFLPTDRIRVAVNHWLNLDATSVQNSSILITTVFRGSVELAYPSCS